MSELKSCPFCGSNDIEVKQYYNDGWYWFVTCQNCKVEKIHQFKGVAIQEWNSRIAEDAKDKEIEKLKEVIAEIGAMTLTGADDVEDFIFMLCKDTVSDEAIKQVYRKHLENNITKMVFGTDNNIPANDTDNNLRERI